MKAEEHERFLEVVSRAFSAGDYANAYETEDYGRALAALKLSGVPAALRSVYRAAFTLGFFGTYELDEMGRHRAAYVAAYQSAGGRACLAAGFCDPSEEIEENGTEAGQ